MSIGRICSRVVHTAAPAEAVLAAAARMKDNNVGALVVLDSSKRPIGMITDRDLVVRVMTEGRKPSTTRVDEVMTHHPRTIAEDVPIGDALASMRQIGVRRLPVVGASGELVGIVSVDDVLGQLAGELGNVGRVIAQSAGGARPPALRTAGKRASAEGLDRAAGDAEC